MPKTAYLFPGQGSQYVGMGRDVVDRFESASRLFETADAVLGAAFSDLLFGTGDDERDAAELKKTENTQPALFLHSMAIVEVLDEYGHTPDVVAGHSLGEYSALAAARSISFEQGLEIVRLRGQLMARAGVERPGSMAAVLGLEDEVIERVCSEVSGVEDGDVVAANFNAPGQVVISGDASAVEAAMTALKEAGARKVVGLPVSGAFHSPLMQHARDDLAAALERLELGKPRFPIYLNVTARPSLDPDEIRTRLLEQLTSPVRWTETLRQMQTDHTDRFLEIGAGNVLAGLVRRTLGRDVQAESVGTADAIQSIVQVD